MISASRRRSSRALADVDVRADGQAVNGQVGLGRPLAQGLRQQRQRRHEEQHVAACPCRAWRKRLGDLRAVNVLPVPQAMMSLPRSAVAKPCDDIVERAFC